jgi:hypothetical protein
MLVAGMVVGGLATYVKLNPAAHRVPEEMRASSHTATRSSEEEDAPEPTRRRHRAPDVAVPKADDDKSLRIPTIDGMDVRLGDPVPPIPDDQDPKVFIATQTFQVANVEKAKALGVTVSNRNAIIDCSPELEGGVGSTQEASLVKAMQMALGQFPEIDTFQFSVDGRVLDTLGALDLEKPIAVIRPGGKETTPSKVPPP